MYGKALRLSNIINKDTKRTCIVPIDHGITLGPIPGIKNYIQILFDVLNGGADAVILHKGLLKEISRIPELTNGHYIMHLSASTALSVDPTYKILVGTVEEAIKLGADAVSVHVNIASMKDTEMLKDFGFISKKCMEWSMPLLAMMYVQNNSKAAFDIAHAARIAEELGADIVKISCPSSTEELEDITSSVRIPVVIAGGEKINDINNLFLFINNSLKAGVSGVAIGRNIFQSKNPYQLTKNIVELIHNKNSYHELVFNKDESVIENRKEKYIY